MSARQTITTTTTTRSFQRQKKANDFSSRYIAARKAQEQPRQQAKALQSHPRQQNKMTKQTRRVCPTCGRPL